MPKGFAGTDAPAPLWKGILVVRILKYLNLVNCLCSFIEAEQIYNISSYPVTLQNLRVGEGKPQQKLYNVHKRIVWGFSDLFLRPNIKTKTVTNIFFFLTVKAMKRNLTIE